MSPPPPSRTARIARCSAASACSPADRPATLQPQEDFPTNLGGLCSKGWNAATILDHPQRLLQPLVRSVPGDRTSEFRPAGWDEVLEVITEQFRRAQASYGLDGVGLFGGGGLTNEKSYALGKFARVVLRTAMIDYNGRFCMSSAATAGNRAFGIDRGLPFPLRRSGRRPRRSCWSGPTRPPPCRRPCSSSTPAGRPAPPTSWSTRGGRPPPPAPRCTCSRCPAPTSRWRTGCCRSRSRTA